VNKVIYKVTYPNGKIYIGKDLTNTLTYFSSVDATYVAADFSEGEMQSFTITKEIIFSSDDAKAINNREAELIREYDSNNPDVGYNRWSKLSPNLSVEFEPRQLSTGPSHLGS
jgi:hypothetical protein